MTENIFDRYNVALSDRHAFINYQDPHSWSQQSVRKFGDGGSQYVAADGFATSVLEQLDRNPSMRLYHDASSNRLIIEFVKTGYDIAARQCLAELMEGCQAAGIIRKDFYAIGSGRHECATNRSKEPDESFKTQATRPHYDDKPALAVEIGFSESLKQLRDDADFWLTHTNRQVKVVMLVHINRDNKFASY